MQVKYDIEIEVEMTQMPDHHQRTERINVSEGGNFLVMLDGHWMSFQGVLGGSGKANDKEAVINAARLVVGSHVQVTKESEDAPGALEDYVGRATSVQLIEVRETREKVEKNSR